MFNSDAALSEIKAKVVKLEADLAAHQRAFERHESRDDARFAGLVDQVEDFNVRNTEQHESIREVLLKLQLRLAWLWGVGFTLVSLAQLLSFFQKE